jgi:hypothetical protein
LISGVLPMAAGTSGLIIMGSQTVSDGQRDCRAAVGSNKTPGMNAIFTFVIVNIEKIYLLKFFITNYVSAAQGPRCRRFTARQDEPNPAA